MKLRAVVAVFAFALLSMVAVGRSMPVSALPATMTWTGNGTSNNWSDAGNWSPGVPLSGDKVIFPASANRKTNTNNLAPNITLSDFDITGSGYTISGNAVMLGGNLFHGASGTNTVNLNLNGPAGIELNAGKLILTGNNSFNDGVSIAHGAILALSDNALGNTAGATYVDSDGALQVSGGVDLPEDVYIDGDATHNGANGDGQLQSLGGTNRIARVFLDEEPTIGVGNSTLIITTLQSGGTGDALRLIGGGKLQVESSFFTGEVNVEDGNFTWNASSQIFVNVPAQGLFRGLGTASSADVYGGTVWPGSGNMPGILEVFNATNFHAGYFRVDIDGPGAGVGYGQLKTNGLQLNSLATVLELDVSIVPSAGDVYRIIDNTSGAVSGTFLDLPEGALFTDSGYVWKISYKGGTGNDVTVTVVRPASADLHIQMSALPSPVAAGQNIVYTVTVTNDGPDKASSPTVSLGTPVGTTFVTSTGPANWSCSIPAPGPTVSCSGPAMAPGDIVTLTLTFKVLPGSAGSVTATAGVSSTTNDPLSGDNSATLVTPIGAADPRPFKRYVIMVARD